MQALKKSVVQIIIFSAALILSLGAMASEQKVGTCSPDSVAGTWGYTLTGTLILPTGSVPFATVGRVSVDAHGKVSGMQTSSAGGSVEKNIIKGTGAGNSDCTGTVTLSIYDESGTTLLRTVIEAVVFVDNVTEEREIVTSLVLEPAGARVPAVLTGTARKLFPKEGKGQ